MFISRQDAPLILATDILFKDIKMGQLIEKWKHWAAQLKIEVYALYFAYQDPRVPWIAKIFTACVVGYAFSPMDLIPDFIPIFGYLDDLILLPLGIKLAISMIPAKIMAESRAKARKMIQHGKPVNRFAAAIIILIWLFIAVFFIILMKRRFD